MAGKTNVETPAPTMADIIRNRAYQLWGVQPESPPKTASKAKKAVAGSKPVKAVAKKTTTKKAAKPLSKAKPAAAKRR